MNDSFILFIILYSFLYFLLYFITLYTIFQDTPFYSEQLCLYNTQIPRPDGVRLAVYKGFTTDQFRAICPVIDK